ncbi:hypothetical protein Nepgr_007906 [Nepenthes gracilis]|uniref:Uncharacterized protein n=1 Tax=Nepenthes gracilis TaxID=150966 RepID=A0AAD3S8N9_NEPGR|nr:hypothetical protein Nepgr_007906 [Nepenthes gracilis]
MPGTLKLVAQRLLSHRPVSSLGACSLRFTLLSPDHCMVGGCCSIFGFLGCVALLVNTNAVALDALRLNPGLMLIPMHCVSHFAGLLRFMIYDEDGTREPLSQVLSVGFGSADLDAPCLMPAEIADVLSYMLDILKRVALSFGRLPPDGVCCVETVKMRCFAPHDALAK